jgi:hypothetical protein
MKTILILTVGGSHQPIVRSIQQNRRGSFISRKDAKDAKVHAGDPDAKIVADYTGGTQSMTAGLAAAALDRVCAQGGG